MVEGTAAISFVTLLNGSCSIGSLYVLLFQKLFDGRRESLGGDVARLTQLYQRAPILGSQRDVSEERHEPELAADVDEAVEVRQLRAWAVGDRLEAADGNAADLRLPGDSGCFHVHESRAVGVAEAKLLRRIGDARGGYQFEFSIAVGQREVF